jgi:hypothetical protein
MEKRTLYALVALVLMGAGAFAVLRAPEKGQRQGPRPRPIAEIKAADVVALELTNEKQEKTTLEKTGDAWRVKTPAEWPADGAGVKSLVEGIEKLAFGDLVTEGAEKHAELGVADGKAGRLTAKGAGGKVLLDAWVGKSIGGFTMLRPVGKNDVWQTSGLFPYMLNKDAKGWRDHAVFELAANDIDKLTVESGGSKLALSKVVEKDAKPGETKWKIDSATGDAPKLDGALDAALVNGATQTLSTLRAADFADDKKPDQVGLAAPVLTVAFEAKGKPYKLAVGTVQGDDVFVKSDASPTIYTLKKYALERVQHKPIDYRDKTLLKATEADLASVDIAHGADAITLEHAGDKWKARGKAPALDDAKVKPVVSGLENVAGSGFSDEKDPAKTGLAKPTGTLTVHLKDKSSTTLKVGAATKDGQDYYVQKAGSPDVMLVKKYVIDRVLKKPSDLSSAPAPAKVEPKKK